MHIPLVLLYVFLVAAPGCTGFPIKRDAIRNTIYDIINIAKTTLVHIQKLRTRLLVAPQIEVSSPSIEGLTNITHELGRLDNELQSPFPELLGQIHADVSSLEGRVRSLARATECPVRDRPAGETRSENMFPDSHLHLTLTKVERYLEKMVLNKDKLEVC